MPTNPFQTYDFRVKWDGRYVAAVAHVNGLASIPGQTDHEPVRLGRGMQIELYDQRGTLAVRYELYHCWPSEYTELPDLDADENVVALASMTIEHEGRIATGRGTGKPAAPW